MNRILEGLVGILCHMDDVLVFGATQEWHDLNLMAVLKQQEAAGVTLNPAKCEFSKTSVKFLGHLLDKNGISADPNKTEAVLHMDTPQSITDLKRFVGMVNQLGKFFSHLADLSQPLRELLSPKNVWTWGPEQEQAFSNVKEELTHPIVLALYDPLVNIKVSADSYLHSVYE